MHAYTHTRARARKAFCDPSTFTTFYMAGELTGCAKHVDIPDNGEPTHTRPVSKLSVCKRTFMSSRVSNRFVISS